VLDDNKAGLRYPREQVVVGDICLRFSSVSIFTNMLELHSMPLYIKQAVSKCHI
jgi:hypothetical protein